MKAKYRKLKEQEKADQNLKWCKQCKTWKDKSEFYPIDPRGGWKMVKCWNCGIYNMKRWSSSEQVGREPDDITELDE